MIAMFRTLLCTLLIVVIWALSVMSFAFYVSRYHLDDNAHADGIVVLTGGGGRIEYGLELLTQGRGRMLFISGVEPGVSLGDLVKGAVLLPEQITLGHQATNTIGNAQEGADWLKRNQLHSVLLVTTDYHMPRALTEFSAQLPPEVTLIPAPVKTQDYRDLAWLYEPETRNMILSEFHKLIAAKIRHLILHYAHKS